MIRRLFAFAPLLVFGLASANATNFNDDNYKNTDPKDRYVVDVNSKEVIDSQENVAFVEVIHADTININGVNNINNNFAGVTYFTENIPQDCEQPILVFGHDTAINSGCSSVEVTITTTDSTGQATTYQWSITGPGTILSGTQATYSFTTTQEGIYTYKVTGEYDSCSSGEQTYTFEVKTKLTPTFANVPTSICEGDDSYTLPLNSDEGIPGTWQPATIDSTTPGIYVFTPTPGECATKKEIYIDIDQKQTPVFLPVDPICPGGSVNFPTTSVNNITGTWSPAFDNTQTMEYTFTPDAGQCAVEFKMTVDVGSTLITPTFSSIPASVCYEKGYNFPFLSNEGIVGSWSPAFDNTQTKEYTFTPVPGQCADEVKVTIAITTGGITPTFSGIPSSICYGTSYTLPFSSSEGIVGSWSPAFDNTQTKEYTFTPLSNPCADEVKVTIVVTIAGTTPTFSNIPSSICYGDNSHALDVVSDEGIVGTWQPAIINSTIPGVYVFTPTLQGCVAQKIIYIDVKQIKTPVFTQLGPFCEDAIYSLPTTSLNNFTGSWSPAINNTTTTEYTFTPDAGQCATTAQMTVVVNPATTVPTFTQIDPLCEGDTYSLPTSSNNTPAITGSWSPAINTTPGSHTYTFTPDAGQCATTAQMTVVVNDCCPVTTTPTFTQIGPFCPGASFSLPTSSNNTLAITGSWSPAIDNSTTTEYTFTPDAGQCATTTKMTVVIISAPALYFDVEAQDLTVECDGNGNITELQDWLNSNGGALVMGGIPLTWTNNYTSLYGIGCQREAEVTFYATDACGNSILTKATFTIEDTTQPVFTGGLPQDTIILNCEDLDDVPVLVATDNCDSNVDVDFKEIRRGANPTNYILERTWTATDSCGNEVSHTQTLNVFCTPVVEIYNGVSANMDGANDKFYIKGIEKYPDNVVWIFNRWGVEVYKEFGYDNITKYWDGTSKGRLTYKKQKTVPEGTYYYIIEYTNFENKRVKQTGYIYFTK